MIIQKKHKSVKEKLQRKLDKEATSISLTTDIWSSAATEAYITVSAHYISPEWHLLSCVLETPGMPERHTGQNIADRLVEIADRWAITKKISIVIQIQDCDTQWNSTYSLLNRLVEIRWPVSAVLSCEQVTKRSDQYLDLNNDQWTLAEELVKVLEPFEMATTFFSYKEKNHFSATKRILLYHLHCQYYM